MKERKTAKPSELARDISYAELVRFAVYSRLGESEPNKSGEWYWLLEELAQETCLSEKTIRNAMSGMKPHTRTFEKLRDAFCRGREFEEWRPLFQEAYDRTKKTSLTRLDAGHGDEDSVHAASDPDGVWGEAKSKIRKLPSSRVTFVGPTYLDIIVFPVHARILHSDVEYSNIYEPQVRLGGSCVFVARQLWGKARIKCDLVTIDGSSQGFWGDAYASMISQEKWISKLHGLGRDAIPSITFQLKSDIHGGKTMFTYGSEKKRFGWSEIAGCLEPTVPVGFVHLSGLAKTSLHERLYENLLEAKPRSFIILDHGRFTPEQKEMECIREIRRALRNRVVDLHISSVRDLTDLLDLERKQFHTRAQYVDSIEALKKTVEAHGSELASITIIRDYNYDFRLPLLWILVGGSLIDLSARLPQFVTTRDGYAYSANKLNGSLISLLVKLRANRRASMDGVGELLDLVTTAAGEQFD